MTKSELAAELSTFRHVNPSGFNQDELHLLYVLFKAYPNWIHAEEIIKGMEVWGTKVTERDIRGNDGLRATTSKMLMFAVGWRIISGSNGYKITEDAQEIAEAERQLTAHAISELGTGKHLREISEPKFL